MRWDGVGSEIVPDDETEGKAKAPYALTASQTIAQNVLR